MKLKKLRWDHKKRGFTYVPVWMTSSIAALVSERLLVGEEEIAVPGEEISLITTY